VHTMPMYARSYRKHPVAEDLAWRGINLPSWPGLSGEQIDYIADSIATFCSKPA
jgi:perosamine synthetase